MTTNARSWVSGKLVWRSKVETASASAKNTRSQRQALEPSASPIKRATSTMTPTRPIETWVLEGSAINTSKAQVRAIYAQNGQGSGRSNRLMVRIRGILSDHGSFIDHAQSPDLPANERRESGSQGCAGAPLPWVEDARHWGWQRRPRHASLRRLGSEASRCPKRAESCLKEPHLRKGKCAFLALGCADGCEADRLPCRRSWLPIPYAAFAQCRAT